MKQALKQEKIKLPGAGQRALTTRNIAERLLQILPQHIGMENATNRSALFRQLFLKSYDDENLGDYFRWEFVRKAMHLLRQRSNCFVINEHINGEHRIYVISTTEEADIYNAKLNQCIKSMKGMQKRADKAIKEKWYKYEFSFDVDKRKTSDGE